MIDLGLPKYYVGFHNYSQLQVRMKSLQLVVVAVFTFFLMEMGASQCDGEKMLAIK